jgi:hypothetical protein
MELIETGCEKSSLAEVAHDRSNEENFLNRKITFSCSGRTQKLISQPDVTVKDTHLAGSFHCFAEGPR